LALAGLQSLQAQRLAGDHEIPDLEDLLNQIIEPINSCSSDLEEEKAKLIGAVDIFANAMKERLIQKMNQGYTGWDAEYPIGNLFDELRATLEELNDGPAWQHGDDRKLVDMANRIMFLHRRASR
jgi:hypothetical protein